MESLLEGLEENRLDALYLFITDVLRDGASFRRFFANLMVVLPQNYSVHRIEAGHEFLRHMQANDQDQQRLFRTITELESLRTLIVSDGYVQRKDHGALCTRIFLQELPRATSLVNLDVHRMDLKNDADVELLSLAMESIGESLEDLRLTGLFVSKAVTSLDPVLEHLLDFQHLRSFTMALYTRGANQNNIIHNNNNNNNNNPLMIEHNDNQIDNNPLQEHAEPPANADNVPPQVPLDLHQQQQQQQPGDVQLPQQEVQPQPGDNNRNNNDDRGVIVPPLPDAVPPLPQNQLLPHQQQQQPAPANPLNNQNHNNNNPTTNTPGPKVSPKVWHELCLLSTLQDLTLRQMHLDDAACIEIARALQQSAFLSCLDLRQNPDITEVGYKAIATALKLNFSSWCTVAVDDPRYQSIFQCLIELNQNNRDQVVRNMTLTNLSEFVENLEAARPNPTAIWYFLSIHDTVRHSLASYLEFQSKIVRRHERLAQRQRKLANAEE